MRDTSFVVAPIRNHAFFEQTVFECQVGHAFLQSTGFAAQILNLAGGCGAGGVAGQTALTRFHELFRPGVIKALGDAFLAAKPVDAVLAAQPIETDAALVFSRSRKSFGEGKRVSVCVYICGVRFRTKKKNTNKT